MNVYHFHHSTGEYLGSSEPDADPLDPGNVLVPAFATLAEPLEPAAGFAIVFVDDEWSHIADHRNEFWWEAGGRRVKIDFLGDPAERGLLDEEPKIEPDPPTLADYEDAIQGMVDATAKEKLFRDGVTLASYTASTNPQWAAEAVAFVAWRYPSGEGRGAYDFGSSAMMRLMTSGSHCSSTRNCRTPHSQVRTSARNSFKLSTPRSVKVVTPSSVPS
ncbi:hypothetical protein [Shinella sumterensis]|uniref:hypothetical protein n=1 Tax=Shinella sumterensis TaxID=1967501 RepID=UPI001E4E3591|nr:hypothetical protein [Shinella sumterensis]